MRWLGLESGRLWEEMEVERDGGRREGRRECAVVTGGNRDEEEAERWARRLDGEVGGLEGILTKERWGGLEEGAENSGR